LAKRGPVNDDIYGIEIIYLEERLNALVNILAMGIFF
jgi:hypothetical protein